MTPATQEWCVTRVHVATLLFISLEQEYINDAGRL